MAMVAQSVTLRPAVAFIVASRFRGRHIHQHRPAGPRRIQIQWGSINAMPYKRENPNAFKTILMGLDALNAVQGRVGWFPSAKYENGVPVAYVMAIQELGSPGNNIPARPTARPTIAQNQGAWRDLALSASRQTIRGKISAYDAVAKLTQKAENDWKETILRVTDPPLSPVTIELRAMKKANPNLKVTQTTVWEAIRRIKAPGYKPPSVNTKPLIDSGHAIATLTNVVEVA